MSTTKIAHTRFFAQICHEFQNYTTCTNFLPKVFTAYKFVQAVPHFTYVFKRQQISKFAKIVKPLPHLLQSFDRILRIFSKIFGNFAGIFFVRSFRCIWSDFTFLCRLKLYKHTFIFIVKLNLLFYQINSELYRLAGRKLQFCNFLKFSSNRRKTSFMFMLRLYKDRNAGRQRVAFLIRFLQSFPLLRALDGGIKTQYNYSEMTCTAGKRTRKD